MKRAYRLSFDSVADAKKLTVCLREGGSAVAGQTNTRTRDTNAAPTKFLAIAKECQIAVRSYTPFELEGSLPNRDSHYKPEDGPIVKKWFRDQHVSLVVRKRPRRRRLGW